MELVKALAEKEVRKPVVKTYDVDGKKLEVTINPVITFTNLVSIVYEIESYVFTDNSNTADSYHPEFIDIARKTAIVRHCTDLPLESDIDTIWFILNTGIYDDILAEIGEGNVFRICGYADKKIELRKQCIANKTDFNAIIGMIAGIGDKLKSSLADIDMDSIMKIVGALPNGAGTDELVETILNIKGKQGTEK